MSVQLNFPASIDKVVSLQSCSHIIMTRVDTALLTYFATDRNQIILQIHTDQLPESIVMAIWVIVL